MVRKETFAKRANSLGYILRAPYQKLSKQLYGSLAALGFRDIRPSHSAVLRNIGPDGNRVTEMAEMAEMTKQSMGYLVDSLEKTGYVRLQPDPKDGRAKLVFLTPKGNKLLNALLETSNKLETSLSDSLGPDFTRNLRTSLQQLDEFLDQAPTGSAP